MRPRQQPIGAVTGTSALRWLPMGRTGRVLVSALAAEVDPARPLREGRPPTADCCSWSGGHVGLPGAWTQAGGHWEVCSGSASPRSPGHRLRAGHWAGGRFGPSGRFPLPPSPTVPCRATARLVPGSGHDDRRATREVPRRLSRSTAFTELSPPVGPWRLGSGDASAPGWSKLAGSEHATLRGRVLGRLRPPLP